MGILSAIQLRVRGFCPKVFVHGAFVRGGVVRTPCLRISWQQPIRRVQSGTFWLNVIITQKKY